jgi:hypothetical protein
MKAILEFNLPEEEFQHQRAIHCDAAYAIIADAKEQIRKWLKYEHEFQTPTQALEACRSLLIFENPLEQP